MDDRSWWVVSPDPPALALPDDLRARDALQGRDCGWVSQMRPFVRQFCAAGGTVFDPFCGFATTLLAAHLEGRAAIGLEVDPARAGLARERLRRHDCTAPVLEGALPATRLPARVQLCLTNVPYFGCRWPGEARAGQLYASGTYAQYLDGLRDVFHAVRAHLDPDAHCIVMVENVVAGDRAIPLVHDVAAVLGGLFAPCEERLLCYERPARPLVPGDSRSNRSHETALVFRHRREVLDLDAADALLAALHDAGFAVDPWGSFVAWRLDSGTASHAPSDLDLRIAADQDAVDRLAAWLENRGFSLSLWGRSTTAPVSLDALRRHGYLRAVRLSGDGARLQVDLSIAE